MAHRRQGTTIPVGTDIGDVALLIICDWCKALIGEPCTDRIGKPFEAQDLDGELKIQVHICRIAPIMQAYRAGRRRGRAEMKEELDARKK